jgi:hypothetical protein
MAFIRQEIDLQMRRGWKERIALAIHGSGDILISKGKSIS